MSWRPKEQIVYKNRMCQTCFDHYPNSLPDEERKERAMREETYPSYPDQEYPLCSHHAFKSYYKGYSNCAFCGYTKEIITMVNYGGYTDQNICQKCLQMIIYIAEGI